MKRSWLVLPLFIGVCFATSLTGAVAPPGAWYAGLDKPFFTPPPWVFGPVWTTLYTLMGGAAWRVWRAAGLSGARVALGLFAGQLAANAAWSPIFFGMHRMDLAFAVIAGMWLLIAATIVAFDRHDRVAAWMMAPTLAWVSVASALNLGLWWLNPDAIGG
jgi:benzodiazapine receptor